MYLKIKKRTYEILDVAKGNDRWSRAFDIFIMTLIALNVAAVILETVAGIQIRLERVFAAFEQVSIAVFTVEYILRFWSCTSDRRYSHHPVKGRLIHSVGFFSIVDLMAILPFYLPMIIPLDLRFVRALRLLRLFRLLKLGRYSDAIQTIGDVLRDKKEELVITVFVGAMLLILASSLMFYVENQQQPDSFSSIPAAMWWGVTALTTVGYGDMFPITPLGKALASLIAFLGIGMFALPAGIFGSGFVEGFQKKKGKGVARKCPHCGQDIAEFRK